MTGEGRVPIPPVLPMTLQELRFWGPEWLVCLPLTQAASHPLYPCSLSTGAQLYPIGRLYITLPPNPTKITLIITKGMQEPQNKAVQGRALACHLRFRLTSQQSCFQKPLDSPGPKHASSWEAAHESPHPRSHWASSVTRHGLPGGLQRLWLSSPATDQLRDLGPKLWEPGFGEQRAQLWDSSEKATQDGK